MARVAINETLEAANQIKNTWTSNPTFTLGDFTFEAFSSAIKKVNDLSTAIDTKRHELQGLLDQRDDAARLLWDYSTRARSGIRAVFGPDSPQYDQAGGTRRSERRSARPSRAVPKAVAKSDGAVTSS